MNTKLCRLACRVFVVLLLPIFSASLSVAQEQQKSIGDRGRRPVVLRLRIQVRSSQSR